MRLSTSRRSRLAAAAIALSGALPAAAHASWPGANGDIAVFAGHTDRTSFSGELRSVHLNGSPPDTLGACFQSEVEVQPPGVPELCSRGPAYSKDGARLAFSLSNGRLATSRPDGSQRVVLPATTEFAEDPAWGPGGQIVFTGTVAGKRNLYVVNPDGGGLRQLTRKGGRDAAWSVRDRIAYVRRGRVYTIDSQGKGKRFVAKGDHPDWSPTGARLVFDFKNPALDNERGLRIIRLKTGKRRTLGTTGEQPLYSPNGKRIAYLDPPGDEESDLFVLRLATGKSKRLFFAGSAPAPDTAFSFAAEPAWQPLPAG